MEERSIDFIGSEPLRIRPCTRARIETLLPGKVGDPGRTAVNNRLFADAVLWVLRSGARWSDLPPRYSAYKSLHKRFTH